MKAKVVKRQMKMKRRKTRPSLMKSSQRQSFRKIVRERVEEEKRVFCQGSPLFSLLYKLVLVFKKNSLIYLREVCSRITAIIFCKT